jgi:hypothetical protein
MQRAQDLLAEVETRLAAANAALDTLSVNIDESNAAFAKTSTAKNAGQSAESKKDDMVFIGMGDGAAYEAGQLKKVANEGVTDIRQRGGEYNTTVTTKAGVFDVSTEDGIYEFLDTVTTDEKKLDALIEIMEGADPDARDEIAQIIQVFNQAENDDREMDRMVLSGHSGGDGIWGDNNAELKFETLQEICDQFPEAAAQVKDLMLSACNSGGEAGMEQYKEMFPNLKSVWAYTDSSPGAHSGAVTHMKLWEKKTEGEGTEGVSPDAAKGTRKGKNVATWTEDKGYEGKEHRDIDEVLDEYDSQENFFKAYYTGRKEVKDTSSGPMRDYYNLINSALFNPALPGGRKTELNKRKKLVQRVLFYKVVRKKFTEAHAEKLAEAYSELGFNEKQAKAKAKAYATMGRGEMIQVVEQFKQDGGDDSMYRLLYAGLVKLNPKVIPQNWV